MVALLKIAIIINYALLLLINSFHCIAPHLAMKAMLLDCKSIYAYGLAGVHFDSGPGLVSVDIGLFLSHRPGNPDSL